VEKAAVAVKDKEKDRVPKQKTREAPVVDHHLMAVDLDFDNLSCSRISERV